MLRRVQIVAMMSLYKEGGLALDGFRSLTDLDCPIVIAEGRAGPPLEADCPETDYSGFGRTTVHRGEWESDAEKRTWMIRYVQAHWQGPTWGVWLDGDEVFREARYLPGLLQAITEQDQVEGDPDEPVAGWPVLEVEMDGSVGICLARCLRVDLIDEYIVSGSVIRFKNGVTLPLGHLPYNWQLWHEQRAEAREAGREFLRPPYPCEPYIAHRSHLRHPLRRPLRLHEAEPAELARLGFPQ